MENYIDTQNNYSVQQLQKAANILKEGGIVLFPTETVYGLGTNALNINAVKKLYQVKKRNPNNPVNLLVSNKKMIEEVVQNISPMEYQLMEKFFPGPFTIILEKKEIIPDVVTANSNLVGIRMPNHPIAKKLVELANVPIAAPSANLSGKPSKTNLENLSFDLLKEVDFIINDGNSTLGIESTVVKVINEIPHILRPGFITPNQIKEISKNVVLEEKQSNFIHYQLNCKSILVYSKDSSKMVDYILNLCRDYQNPLIICCQENLESYPKGKTIAVASKNNLKEYSKNLFSCLQKADVLSPDIIFLEGVEKSGLGIAIMDRMQSVCQNNFIEIK